MPYAKAEDRRACSKRYYARNGESEIERSRRARKGLKLEVLAAYGGACECCGETEEMFLSIDHIRGGGKKHLKDISMHLYRWLKQQGFPKEDFRILCHNCNRGTYFNGGICPHKDRIKMAKYRPNPLGLIEGEVIWNGVTEKGASMDGFDVESAPSFRAQTPVKEGLAGQDTFAMDATSPSSRADVELRRMHLPGGGKEGVGPKEGASEILEGANMFNEFGGGTGKSAGEFTANENK